MEIEGAPSPQQWNGRGSPGYATLLGSIDHVIQSSLGGFVTDQYYANAENHWHNPMTKYIYPLFLLLVFCECILLLNLLIAVMNDSFLNNNEVVESTKRQQQLEFVVDNWWIDPIQDKKNIVYLVAAFSMDNEKKKREDGIFEEIKNEITTLNQRNEHLIS
jgi:hypothetical protein